MMQGIETEVDGERFRSRNTEVKKRGNSLSWVVLGRCGTCTDLKKFCRPVALTQRFFCIQFAASNECPESITQSYEYLPG